MHSVTFRSTLAFLLILTGRAVFAQLPTSAERTAIRRIEKHRWQRAEATLRRALVRDTLNASIRYVMSEFYFHRDNPDYDLDSAHHYAVTALADYAVTAERERDRLARMSIDSLHLMRLNARVDSAAFAIAREANTERAYLYFIDRYPQAAQRHLAEELRDEVAYQDALRGGTYQDFDAFMKRYPHARRVPEARSHYERLLYLDRTKDKRLASYEGFLSEHPQTPYRSEIVRQIFEISTADGTVASFLRFIRRYGDTNEAKKARQLVFYLLAGEEDVRWPSGFLTDSLRNLLSLNQTYLAPVLNNKGYGFIDKRGREIFAPQFGTIDPAYLCGLITDDVLKVDDRLVLRNGAEIYRGPVNAIDEIGAGFVKVETPSAVKLIHKGGFHVADSLQDARLLSHSYLALRKFDAWFLYTLTGRLLDANPWEDIDSFGSVVAFRSGKKTFLVRKDALGKIADGHPLEFSTAFDEVRAWPHDLIWVRAGRSEGVFDQDLRLVIPMRRHTLTQTFFGVRADESGGPTLYNWLGQPSSGFEAVNIFDRWVTVKDEGKWRLFDPRFGQIESRPYDTITSEGAFVVGHLTDSLYVHFRGNRVRMFTAPVRVSFIPGMDTTSFLLVQREKEKTIYDLTGRKLFATSFDGVSYAGEGIFSVTRNGKIGLVDARGKTLLAPEYDAVGSVQHQLVSLLKNKHFGCYNIAERKLIKPQYDRNLYPYARNWVTTFRDGHYGFLDWNNKPVSKFGFDEVTYWNDSVALVRQGTFWNLYDIAKEKVLSGNIRSIRLISNTEDEKVAIVQRDNNFGVISNRRGVVVPISFSDIINVGSAEEPLYFTEKQVREASLFVVIYYDSEGRLLRKEIYEDPAQYDRIYCPDP